MAQEQMMKPETAAKKLGVLLEASPQEFRGSPISRTGLNELLTDPPEWLTELRRVGPHPRPVVATKLGVSVAGLKRGGVEHPLTTAEVQALLAEKPEWLVRERETNAAVMAENARIKHGRAAGGSRPEPTD